MSTIATAPVEPKRGARSIEELLSNVSASRLSTWSQCRLKFYFRYVLGPKKKKPVALHLGSSVHAVLKYWNKARWKGEHSSLRQLHDVYSSSWTDEQEKEPVEWESGEETEQKKTGWRLLETYFRESPIQTDEKPEAVEVTVQADLSGHGLPTLVGIIDLVRPGGRIVDFKTSSKNPDVRQVAHLNDMQLTSYGILYRDVTGKKESGLELHHLVKTKNPKLVVTVLPPIDDVQETRLFHVMESYVEGLQRNDFVPSPGMQCANCEFLNECKAWC